MEETQKQPKNKVSSVGSTSACLSVTLICICNQMKDWKAAFGLEGRTEIEQPEAHYLISTSAQCFLSMCCSPMVMFPLHHHSAGEAENTSCCVAVRLVYTVSVCIKILLYLYSCSQTEFES